MKLFKDGRVMQMVDKDQLETCLEAGWSRTDEVAAKAKKEEAEALAEEAAKAEADEESEVEKEKKPAPLKTVKIVTSKKK